MNVLEQIFAKVDSLVDMIPYLDKIPLSAILIPAVFAIIALLASFKGSNLISSFKFVICAGAGFAAVYYFITSGKLVIPEQIMGLLTQYIPAEYAEYIPLGLGAVGAVVLGLLSNMLYTFVFAGVFGYAAYLLVPVVAVKLNIGIFAENPLYIYAAVAAVAIAALIFRRPLEIICTAFGGAFCLFLAFHYLVMGVTAQLGLGQDGLGFVLNNTMPLFDVAGIGVTFAMLVCAAMVVMVGLTGLLNQLKGRNRYRY